MPADSGQSPIPNEHPRVPGSRPPRDPHDASTTPRDLKLKTEQQVLLIDWADGSRHELPLSELRRQCPCATCRTQREESQRPGTNPLQVLKSDPAKLRATGADLVGTYGLRLRWSDGHDTGIFDFRFLRQLADSG
ncbi:MAG: DUF971 domain-containing protein [Phycisphaerae bacterium]|jgi:DUF971 family protein